MSSSFIMAIDQGYNQLSDLYHQSAGEVFVAKLGNLFKQIFPMPGWVEHDPEDIWFPHSAQCVWPWKSENLQDLRSANQYHSIRCGNSDALGDGLGKPLHNAIDWSTIRKGPGRPHLPMSREIPRQRLERQRHPPDRRRRAGRRRHSGASRVDPIGTSGFRTGPASAILTSGSPAAPSPATAGRARASLWLACLSHHYAQFLWFHDPVRRDEGQMRKVALYRSRAAVRGAGDPFRPAFEGFVIPYLRLPRWDVRPRAGRDRAGRIGSTKESYRFEKLCLARMLRDLHVRRTGAGRDVFPGQAAAGLPSVCCPRCWIGSRSGRRSTPTASASSAAASAGLRRPFRRPRSALQGLRVLGRVVRPVLLRPDARSGAARICVLVALSQEHARPVGPAERVRCPVYALHGAQDV